MNRFKKYCPNVWVAECEEEYEKGDVIEVTTRNGKEVECEVYNLVNRAETEDKTLYYYSIVRLDEGYAEKKARKYNDAVQNSMKKANERWEASNEGHEFLSLGEPIKVGHHSEKKHRALLQRNLDRVEKAIEYEKKAEEQREKAKYWERKAKTITLADPESLEYFKTKLIEATEYHKKLKDNPELRAHAYSLTYARKSVNDYKKKVKTAEILWGVQEN